MKRYYFLLFAVLGSPVAYGASEPLLKSQLNVSGKVVGSTCVVSIYNKLGREGVVSFKEYNKAIPKDVSETFSVRLFNKGGLPGCDAFRVMDPSGLVSLKFGDGTSSQLDREGVVTTGAGGRVRIAISATDQEAMNSEVITFSSSTVKYKRDFAVKGVFNFKAKAKGLDGAPPGRYSGSLSVVVSYK